LKAIFSGIYFERINSFLLPEIIYIEFGIEKIMQPIIRKPNAIDRQKAALWPVWQKEKSTFAWSYDDKEECLILEGKAIVINESGKEFAFETGDYVVFPKGMKCTWKILEPIRKHYNFG
jgi:uncharacterized protein